MTLALTSELRRRRAFTLTELLVVIALIVLLVALLLAALNQVQAKAKKTSTLATMQAFANACNAFAQEHGFLPGIVPEDVLAFHTRNNPADSYFTGTENALLHLMGGYVRAADDLNAYNATTGPDWAEFKFDHPQGGTYDVKVNVKLIGQGPVIHGKPYAPYFTPSEKELQLSVGQVAPVDGQGNPIPNIPDLVDAWGTPIVYLRQLRPTGVLLQVPPALGQFDPAPAWGYVRSAALGAGAGNQMLKSMLNTGTVTDGDFVRLLSHDTLDNQARGAFMLMSAGKDTVFFAENDGEGTTDVPVRDFGTLPGKVLDSYDDVLVFGGA